MTTNLTETNQNFTKFNNRFAKLDSLKTVSLAEYIWIDGSGVSMRSKTMRIPGKVSRLEDFPDWNFDGSSTGQAEAENSEIVIKPVFFCRDPFRASQDKGKKAFLVLCETYLADGKTPAKANFRHYAEKAFADAEDEEPWFGYEQEYILLQHEGTDRNWPIGFPKDGYPQSQGQYYCSVGASNSIARYIAEAHLNCCIHSGLEISGTNAEVFPGQWEFQIGPVKGIEGCDQLWMARFILTRVCEEFDIDVTFEPKPIKGDWNGSGCHANMSYESTRKEGGYEVILEAMKELERTHKNHALVYGTGNEDRLDGKCETASINEFKYGVGDRSASVRIGNKTKEEGKGYFEDRRPSANMDPYLVGGMLVDSAILKSKYGEEIVEAYKKFQEK